MPPTKQDDKEAAARGPRRNGAGSLAPGARLAAAFEAVESFPALIESRTRAIDAATADTVRVADLIAAIESDVGLTIAVMRGANRPGGVDGGAASVSAAVTELKRASVLAMVGTAPVFDFFEPNGGWELRPERLRVHALTTQRAATEIARAVSWVDRDDLVTAAALHDVGRLVISKLHPGKRTYLDAATRTPEQRLKEEREQLGIDHALVGGVLARRWNIPQRLAIAIERHHSEDADGLAAMVATADMVAHYSQGEAVSGERLQRMAQRCGLGRTELRELLYEFPRPHDDAARIVEPCPLSAREMDVLKCLSGGMVYKQIAGEMGLSVSTIRTHLHNIYGKIGAVDRAQAVLAARDKGWL